MKNIFTKLFALAALFVSVSASAQVVYTPYGPQIVRPMIIAPLILRPPIIYYQPRAIAVPIASIKNFVQNGQTVQCIGRKLVIYNSGQMVTSQCDSSAFQNSIGSLDGVTLNQLMTLGHQIQNTGTLTPRQGVVTQCGYAPNMITQYFAIDGYSRLVAVGGQRGCQPLVMSVDTAAAEQLTAILTQLRIRYLQ